VGALAGLFGAGGGGGGAAGAENALNSVQDRAAWQQVAQAERSLAAKKVTDAGEIVDRLLA
jgi:hypothetical protein